MKIIYNSIFLEHDTGMHPENINRLTCFDNLPETRIDNNDEYLRLVHTKDYIQIVKEASRRRMQLDPDTVTSEHSYDAAVGAVNATIQAIDDNDFALVRPPGHHAYPDHSSGFCLFNNVAIASKYLVNEGKRVLIFDFDGHLGDGTFNYFYDTDEVFYWSIHQYPAFPGGGDYNEIGRGKGKGFTLNIPLPAGTADDVYIRAFKKFIPIARQFDPDVVAISAGFDTYRFDLLLNLKLSLAAYHTIGKIIRKNFPKAFATLEGGYNTSALPNCVWNFIDGFNGKEMRHVEPPTESDIKIIQEYDALEGNIVRHMSNYWSL